MLAFDRDAEIAVKIKNRGNSSGEREVELKRGGSIIDNRTVSLAVDETEVITFIDSTFSEDDIASVYDYRVHTGNREPQFEATVIGVWRSDDNPTERPEHSIARIEFSQTEGIAFDQETDVKLQR